MAKVLIETYGCTLNQADSDIMQGLLQKEGHLVESGKYAAGSDYDYVIVNTCTVKNPTEQRILDKLSTMKHLGSRLIVTGCMASANQDKIMKRAPRSSIVTTSNVHKIVDALSDISAGMQASYDAYERTDKVASLTPTGSVIARIPISEGCLSSCNFCGTKFARGPLNSFSSELIIKAIKNAVERGAKEIELTSQDVGAYGLDRKTNIAELVSTALDITGDFKIRIGRLNPEHLVKYFDALVDVYESRKVYKFIHLPVQSGSNSVLKEMSRNYSVETFRNFVSELKGKIDDISIATDMIVGYPTETDTDFEKSMQLIADTKLSRINISKFGARPHTKASRLKQIPGTVIKERSSLMYRLARQIEMEALTKVIGTTRQIIVTENNNISLVGRDDSYRQVAVKGDSFRLGDILDVEIFGNTSVCLLGRPVEVISAINH